MHCNGMPVTSMQNGAAWAGNAEATNKDNGGSKGNNARRVEVSLLKNDVQTAEQH